MEKILLCLSIALFAGLMLSRLAKLCKLPAVTAYLVAGIIIGPCCIGAIGIEGLGFISTADIGKYSILSEVALGFIAFAIGNEFRLKQLKQIGKQATIIGILQAVITTIIVDVALIVVHFIIPDKFPLPCAIVLGAIASATAPAATLMVVKQYKAKGPVTSTLLPVVALDDAVGLVLFAISFGVAKAISTGHTSIVSVVVEPLLEIILSILLGTLMGLIFTFCERFFHSRSKRLAMSVAFVFITVAISMFKNIYIGSVHIGFSSLLSCMMLGTIFCNICDFSAELMDRLDRWTAPVCILFFVISGAELDLKTVFSNYTIIIIGLIYIAFRCLGKYFGAYGSSKISKSPDNVRKYLGITLFPQAGVALGMAAQAFELGTLNGINMGSIISNVTLFSVLFYEIFGPFLTKIALTKAGEIDPAGQTSNRIKHHDREKHNSKI